MIAAKALVEIAVVVCTIVIIVKFIMFIFCKEHLKHLKHCVFALGVLFFVYLADPVNGYFSENGKQRRIAREQQEKINNINEISKPVAEAKQGIKIDKSKLENKTTFRSSGVKLEDAINMYNLMASQFGYEVIMLDRYIKSSKNNINVYACSINKEYGFIIKTNQNDYVVSAIFLIQYNGKASSIQHLLRIPILFIGSYVHNINANEIEDIVKRLGFDKKISVLDWKERKFTYKNVEYYSALVGQNQIWLSIDY